MCWTEEEEKRKLSHGKRDIKDAQGGRVEGAHGEVGRIRTQRRGQNPSSETGPQRETRKGKVISAESSCPSSRVTSAQSARKECERGGGPGMVPSAGVHPSDAGSALWRQAWSRMWTWKTLRFLHWESRGERMSPGV